MPTEGVFHNPVNICANLFEQSIYLTICKAYNNQVIAFQNSGPKSIAALPFLGIMLRAVNFNNEFRFMAIEIGNKMVNGFLPLKPHFIFS